MNNNKPTHIAYTVRDGKDKDGKPTSFWRPIGAAWAHKDLNGMSIQLDAFPVDGRIQLRVATERPEGAEDTQAA